MTDKEKIKELEEEIEGLRDSLEEQRNIICEVIVDLEEWELKYKNAMNESMAQYRKLQNYMKNYENHIN